MEQYYYILPFLSLLNVQKLFKIRLNMSSVGGFPEKCFALNFRKNTKTTYKTYLRHSLAFQ